jgi:hypothetical protein
VLEQDPATDEMPFFRTAEQAAEILPAAVVAGVFDEE